MPKEIIQFSHANGFPALTYKTLFSFLEDQFEIRYIETLGHDPEYPVSDNWTSLANELVKNLELSGSERVIGIGHSLGGAITWFAAQMRPDLFKAIVLLDTPIFSYLKTKVIQWLKKLGLIHWITPGGRRQRRRTHWSSFEEALAYFRTRPLFQNFSEQCLRDYITYGMHATKEGLELKFDPSIEMKIYQTLPHNYWDYQKKLQIPCVAIVGRHSTVINHSDFRSMEKRFNMHCKEVPGGHLFPFEYPKETAIAIKESISEMLNLKQ